MIIPITFSNVGFNTTDASDQIISSFYLALRSRGIGDGDTNGQLVCPPHLLGKHLKGKCRFFRKEERSHNIALEIIGYIDQCKMSRDFFVSYHWSFLYQHSANKGK
jgi:hypothetical protein